jgi:sulfur relay (sulfurtransferase) DsrF/TusC family protein
MKVLQIIESAYRCTIEEQDDPTIWITHAMKGAGADFDVLLRANAVNYAVKDQNAYGMTFGRQEQTHPPMLDRDISQLMDKGIGVYLVKEDLADRGIAANDLIGGVETIPRDQLPSIFAKHDQVWHW